MVELRNGDKLETQIDEPDDLEFSEPYRDPEEMLTDNILTLLATFTTNQKDLLYTADYIVKQRAELDDVKEITRQQLQLDMPGTQGSGHA